MSDSPYCTALAHLALVGSSVWALLSLKEISQYNGNLLLAYGSFGLHLLQSAVGVFRFGNPDYGSKVRRSYNNITLVNIIFGFPFIVAQMYFTYNSSLEVVCIHLASTLVPLISLFTMKDNKRVLDIVLAINVVSIICLCLMKENFYGVATGVSFSINCFLISYKGRVCDLPAVDLYTYGLCFLNYFSVKALRDQIVL